MADTQSSPLSANDIHRYWTQQAARHGCDPEASWSDRHAIELEIRAIAPRIPAGAVVADLGCGNGWSTVHYLERAEHVTGVDYVPELIDAALLRAETLSPELRARVQFTVGDVRALDLDDGSVDCVVVTRVLINLASSDERVAALGEVARILKPGGFALISEATVEGWSRLNALRAEWGLEQISVPVFNRYVDEQELRDEAAPLLDLEEIVDFASSYFVVTRVLKPLLARIPQVEVDAANPGSEFNRWAATLPAAGDYGTQKLFVFSRSGSATAPLSSVHSV